MNSQLEILLQIQDLKSQRRELTSDEGGIQEETFRVEIDRAIGHLERKIAELESQLAPEVRGRYERLRDALPRPVVPVIEGTCYGCFISIPTAHASDADRNATLMTCQNCGRFLYVT